MNENEKGDNKMVEKAEEIYHLLLNAGLDEREIKDRIKQKNSEFQGLMTKDAILYLIAKEHGVKITSLEDSMNSDLQSNQKLDYNDFLVQISQISPELQNIVIKGEVSNTFGIREFVRKDGSPGSVGTFEVCDKSGCIKVVLWGDQAKILENEVFGTGIAIQIIGGYSKAGLNDQLEVHLSRKGKIILPEEKKSNKAINSPKTKGINPSKLSIQDLLDKEGFVRSISGIVTIELFKEITKKNGEKTFLLKLTLNDGTGSICVNIWDIKAVELAKSLANGDNIKISNVMIKLNSYSNAKEVSLTKNSDINPL